MENFVPTILQRLDDQTDNKVKGMDDFKYSILNVVSNGVIVLLALDGCVSHLLQDAQVVPPL